MEHITWQEFVYIKINEHNKVEIHHMIELKKKIMNKIDFFYGAINSGYLNVRGQRKGHSAKISNRN